MKNRSGFALTSTLSVLLLLAVITVALLSMSTVTLRTSRVDFDKEEARSAARLSLMMALNQLQKHAGPDQRITALAEQQTAFENTTQSKWTGVYESWIANLNPGQTYQSLHDAQPATELTANLNLTNGKFGRRFEIMSFRWLQNSEI